jgi:predicted ester cyclase
MNAFFQSRAIFEGRKTQMSTEENKVLVRRFYEEVHNRGNLGAIDEFIDPSFVDHTPVTELAPGIEGVKQVFTMLTSAFPDFRLTVEEQIAEGDKVMSRGAVTATHKGEFMGIAPTGKQIKLNFIEILGVVAGKITDRWEIVDQMGLMQQLGIIPPPQ